MIELLDDSLDFQFPGVDLTPACSINFQRTLRIPDDNHCHQLPPGLGRFPVRHIDDYALNVPQEWVNHGGVFIPMYQSEALWISFHGYYPCAVKIAAGKINAVDGSAWTPLLSRTEQDYVVIPGQCWIDGFNTAKDYIRQFVAMPLGEGYTAEEQMTGEATHGGLQIVVFPMKYSYYRKQQLERLLGMQRSTALMWDSCQEESVASMGLAPGGLMRQEIFHDTHGWDAWDQENSLRCFVHLANSAAYTDITGTVPPQKPATAKQYNDAGLPWFDYYSDAAAIAGSKALGGLTSTGAMHIQQTGQPLQNNESITPANVKNLKAGKTIRQGNF